MRHTANIKVTDLAEVLGQELTTYHENVIKELNNQSHKAMKELVSKTKATAPTGKRNGAYRDSISSKVEKRPRGNIYTWYAKTPNHRLTHLLVHGHATKDGGRTKADPFLENALNSVLPQYEERVKEAIKK